MRTTLTLVIITFCLSLGCSAGDGEPLPDEESAAENVDQAEQEINSPCFQDCQCPLTERCGSNYYCESYAVWGPDSSPLKCVNDCQCQTWWSPGYFCHMDSGSYGHCKPYPP
jgi:hypothetical protein